MSVATTTYQKHIYEAADTHTIRMVRKKMVKPTTKRNGVQAQGVELSFSFDDGVVDGVIACYNKK